MVTVVGTHSGRFHADEALAIALIKRFLKQDLKIIRSRDPQDWAKCEYLVDVGGEYDHVKKRYDHHQASFQEYFPGRTVTIMSSAGLVYLHYGKQILKDQLDFPDEETVLEIFEKLYSVFIEPFDAVDNGVERSAGPFAYERPYDIFGMVGDLNPEWYEGDVSEEEMLERFMKAVELVGDAFDRFLTVHGKSALMARKVVAAAMEESLNDPVLTKARCLRLRQGCLWKENVLALEETFNCKGHFLYCIYPEKPSDKNTKWRIQAVPVAKDSFLSRRPLPEAWRGARDQDLDLLLMAAHGDTGSKNPSTLTGATFVHKTGFIGGHATEEGVIFMAHVAANANE